MRIGLVGTGRIGSFHATTLQALDGVDSVLVADADASRAHALAAATGLEAVPDVDALYTDGVDAWSSPQPRAPTPPWCTRRSTRGAGVLREAGRPRRARHPRGRRPRRNAAGYPCRSASSGGSTRLPRGPAALLDGDLGWLHTVRAVTGDRARPRRRTSPPPAASSATAASTTSTSCAGSPAARSSPCTPSAPTGARGSSPRPATSTPCAARLRFDDDTLATVSASRYNGAGYDVRLERADRRTLARRPRRPRTDADRRAPVSCRGPALPQLHGTLPRRLRGRAGAASSKWPRARVQPCPPEEALQALYIAEACDRSRHRGRPVGLAEVLAQRSGNYGGPG